MIKAKGGFLYLDSMGENAPGLTPEYLEAKAEEFFPKQVNCNKHLASLIGACIAYDMVMSVIEEAKKQRAEIARNN